MRPEKKWRNSRALNLGGLDVRTTSNISVRSRAATPPDHSHTTLTRVYFPVRVQDLPDSQRDPSLCCIVKCQFFSTDYSPNHLWVQVQRTSCWLTSCRISHPGYLISSRGWLSDQHKGLGWGPEFQGSLHVDLRYCATGRQSQGLTQSCLCVRQCP